MPLIWKRRNECFSIENSANDGIFSGRSNWPRPQRNEAKASVQARGLWYFSPALRCLIWSPKRLPRYKIPEPSVSMSRTSYMRTAGIFTVSQPNPESGERVKWVTS